MSEGHVGNGLPESMWPVRLRLLWVSPESSKLLFPRLDSTNTNESDKASVCLSPVVTPLIWSQCVITRVQNHSNLSNIRCSAAQDGGDVRRLWPYRQSAAEAVFELVAQRQQFVAVWFMIHRRPRWGLLCAAAWIVKGREVFLSLFLSRTHLSPHLLLQRDGKKLSGI